MKKIKTWLTSKDIADLTKKSTRTIERKRNKILLNNPDVNWFKMKSNPYKYHINFLEEFLSTDMFDLIDRNRQMSNTIKCMRRTGTLEQHLSFLDWDYFVTISYENSLNSKTCFSAMSELYEKIEFFSKGTDCRMFFTTEPFSNRKGYHNHLIIKMKISKEKLIDFIINYAPIGRIDVQPYDNELAGVFYVAKNKPRNDDWDLLGNKLSIEGEKLLKNYKSASSLP